MSIAITQTLGLGQTPSPGVPGVLTSFDQKAAASCKKQPQQLAVWVAYRQAFTVNGRPGTLLPYLPRVIPGTRHVVYVRTWCVASSQTIIVGAPEIPCLHHNRGLSQNPPAGVPSVSVPTGLSRHSHQLQLQLHKKKDKTN